MRKKALIAAGIAFVLLATAACSSGGGDDGQKDASGTITLDFPTWQANEPGYKEFWADTTAAFESSHPGVKINLQQVAFADYQQTITTRIAANDAPEILELPTRFFANFADKGLLSSLDDKLKGTDIIESWPEGQKELKWNDEYQGVLVQNYGYVLFYNAKMLQDAGVEIPTTWDELRAAAAKLTGNGVYGIAMDSTQDPNLVLELSWPIVGTGLSYATKGEYNLTDPAVADIADQVRELASSAPQGITSEQKRQYFVDGKAALMIDGPFVGSLLASATPEQQANIKVAPIPFEQVPGALSSSMHIPKSVTGEKRDLAWEYIQMLTEAKWQDAFVKHTGTPAPRKGSSTEGADATATERLEVYSDAVADAVNVVPSQKQIQLNYPIFAEEVSSAVSRLLSSQDSSKDIMAELQKTLEAKIPLSE